MTLVHSVKPLPHQASFWESGGAGEGRKRWGVRTIVTWLHSALRNLMTFAGAPAAMAKGGMSRVTTLFHADHSMMADRHPFQDHSIFSSQA